eukprot:6119091-Amphidinium_carterae.1
MPTTGNRKYPFSPSQMRSIGSVSASPCAINTVQPWLQRSGAWWVITFEERTYCQSTSSADGTC